MKQNGEKQKALSCPSGKHPPTSYYVLPVRFINFLPFAFEDSFRTGARKGCRGEGTLIILNSTRACLLFPTVSCLVVVLSCFVLSCLVMSCRCLVLSCLVVVSSCLILSCLVLSCLVLSLSCHELWLSCIIFSCGYLVLSCGCCLVLSCLVLVLV